MIDRKILEMVHQGRIANEKEQRTLHPTIAGEEICLEYNGRNIPALFYSAKKQNTPVLVNIHGGGFVYGGPEYEDVWCDYVNKELDMNVVNVGYRLAPENPFPCGLNDVYESIVCVYQNAQKFGVNKEQMILCGDSAGANLLTAACYLLKENTDIKPLAQILVYPFLDGETPPEKKFFMKGVIPLERAEMYNRCYYTEENKGNPLSSPILRSVEELKGMPPTWILTCEIDSLRDEGEEYARKLMSAGVEVTGKRAYGLSHGFFMKDHMPEAWKIYKELISYMRWKLS